MFNFCNENADLWIQTKGKNAGQPLKEPIPNSIGTKVNPDVLLPGFMYYTVLYLYNASQFQPHIKGSVIPYITQKDIASVILRHFAMRVIIKGA